MNYAEWTSDILPDTVSETHRHVEGGVEIYSGSSAACPYCVTPLQMDFRWCDIRNERVTVSECVSSCATPEHRPVCWLGRIYRDEPLEGGS